MPHTEITLENSTNATIVIRIELMNHMRHICKMLYTNKTMHTIVFVHSPSQYEAQYSLVVQEVVLRYEKQRLEKFI